MEQRKQAITYASISKKLCVVFLEITGNDTDLSSVNMSDNLKSRGPDG